MEVLRDWSFVERMAREEGWKSGRRVEVEVKSNWQDLHMLWIDNRGGIVDW